jgi:hypothetical protein
MSYKLALEAAGAIIVEYKEFGSYQGTWIAVLKDGTFIEGAYGSCSGCDSFQSEFDYDSSNDVFERDGKYYKSYDEEITFEEFSESNRMYENKLKRFGETYLKDNQSLQMMKERYENRINSNDHFNDEEEEIYNWILSIQHKILKSDSNKVSEFFDL